MTRFFSPGAAPVLAAPVLAAPALAAVVLAGLALSGADSARAQTARITRETCDQLVQQMPAPDVNYQPGVDVNGQPVAPADLPGTPQIAVPQEFSIPITVNLGRRFGFPAGRNFKAEADIGTVTYKDGQAFFNGQPLQDPETAAVAEACKRLMSGQ